MSGCRFSSDSNMIYCGTYEGCLYVYEINKDVRLIYRNKLHHLPIFHLKLTNNYQVITCSDDRFIILSDVKKHK